MTDNWYAILVTAGNRRGFPGYLLLPVLDWIPSDDGKTVGAVVVEPRGTVRQFWPGTEDAFHSYDYGFTEGRVLADLVLERVEALHRVLVKSMDEADEADLEDMVALALERQGIV